MIVVYCPQCYGMNTEKDETCRHCGGLLLEAGGKPYLEKLIWALKHPEPTVSPRAAWVLGERRESQAVEPLISAIDGASDMALLEEAVVALGKIGDPRAIPCLERALRDSYLSVRQRAAWALGRIGGPVVIEVLTSAVDDPNQTVREAALAALSSLSNRTGHQS
ncbi:MAG: HEAT repeat domain-containing protein [Armatimonadetes bacterium]|nr:HEAT repeat domain-containing protein [Armatimonadota bacterium]